jgi:outer membrane protein OmpA-like peptidoglycan-associated protein
MIIKKRRLAVGSLLLMTLIACPPSYADDARTGNQPIPLFETAPPPEQLADLLFPPRYRTVQQNSSDLEDNPEFSMLINFRFDSTQILADSEPMLQSLGEMLGMDTAKGRSIVIEGHTDAVGDEAYNQQLSEARAAAIRQYLVEHYGIAPKRLLVVGKGERQLLQTEDPAASVNRRASFRPARRVILK